MQMGKYLKLKYIYIWTVKDGYSIWFVSYEPHLPHMRVGSMQLERQTILCKLQGT